MASTLIPASRSHFLEDRRELLATLGAMTPNVTRLTRAFNPYPFALRPDEVAELGRLTQCLHRALVVVVENYFQDERLRAILSLDSRVEDLLRVASGRPYRTGGIRPDFLHELGGRILVNEINARFPVNAFFLGHLADAALRRVSYRHRLGKAWEGVATLAEIPRVLRGALGESAQVFVVKGREYGMDIQLFMESWPDCREIRPEEMTDKDEASVFALELHQDELLERLPSPALLSMIRDRRYFNDLRTIFLGHDKRLLAVFTTDLMRDYLSVEDVEMLHRHVVPSYLVGMGGDLLHRARKWPRDWVLKPNLLGKGEGIVIGRSVEADAWCHAIDNAPAHFILQPYIEQQLFDVLDEVDGEVRPIPMRVVGSLPDFDGRPLGPSIYRASPAEIVSVTGGGVILTPVVIPGL